MLLAIVEEQQRATKAAYDQYTKSLEITQLSWKTKLIRQLRTGTKKKNSVNLGKLKTQVAEWGKETNTADTWEIPGGWDVHLSLSTIGVIGLAVIGGLLGWKHMRRPMSEPPNVGPFPFFHFMIKRAHAEASLSLVSQRSPPRVGTAVDPNS